MSRQDGLGDRIESFLKTFGITQQRWSDFKKSVGLPPGCDCPRRIEWLNRFGEEFGQVARWALEKLLGIGKKPKTDN